MSIRRLKLTKRVGAVVGVFLFSLALHASSGPPKASPDQALSQLKKGNQRFASGGMTYPHLGKDRLAAVAEGQQPWATVVSCSDSRVPVEEIFDAGLGDIFVVRVAGNVCDVDEVGSVEYGAEHLGTPVLVVLGHTACGAVTAVATDAVVHGSISPLIDNIKPAVQKAAKDNPGLSGKDLVTAAVTANVWQSIQDLLTASPIVRELVKEGKLKIQGAIYHLDDGKVEWLGAHPREAFLTASTGGGHPKVSSTFYQTATLHVPDVSEARHAEGIDKNKAMQLLKSGNSRYVDGSRTYQHQDKLRLREVTTAQHPYATVVSCSDSRVPVEHIFDAGLGDIFTVRVAGNVCDVDEIGSIEYGIGHLFTPMLVIMGHSACGAVTAVATDAEVSGSIPALVDNIVPAVAMARKEHPYLTAKDLVPEAIKANVMTSMADLFAHSPEACAMVQSGFLNVVGAVYDLETGKVEWLGPHPNQTDMVSTLLAVAGESGHGASSEAAGEAGESHSGAEKSSLSAETGHGSVSSGGMASGHEKSAASMASVAGEEQSGATVQRTLWDEWWFWALILSAFISIIIWMFKKIEKGEFAMKMNVGAKILTGFGVVLAILALTITVATWKMGQIGDSLKEVAEEYIPLTEKISAIEISAVEQGMAFASFRADSDQKWLAMFEKDNELVAEELKGAEEIVNANKVLLESGMMETLKKLEAEHEGFYADAEKLIGELKAGTQGEQVEELSNQAEEEMATLQEATDVFLTQVEHSLDSVSALAEENEKAGFQLIVVLGILGVIAGLTIGWMIARSISRPVTQMANIAQQISQGDIDHNIEVHSKDEIGMLANSFKELIIYMKTMAGAAEKIANSDLTVKVEPRSEADVLGKSFKSMTINLSDMIRQLTDGAGQLVSAANEVASSSEQMSRGAKDQTDQMAQVSTAVEEMTATIVETSKNAGEATTGSHRAAETAGTGGQIVNDTIQGMQKIAAVVRESAESISKLAKSADQIGEIIGVIDDIADQTNLLALNAAIEAARAGEQGRGFAVVADEVRKLAERTGKATGEITNMIKGIQQETNDAVKSMESGIVQVDKGRELADKAGTSLNEIVTMAQQVQDMIQQIATASEEQSSAAEQISKNVENVTAIARESATGAQQSAAAAEELNRQAEAMRQMVAKFKLSQEARV